MENEIRKLMLNMIKESASDDYAVYITDYILDDVVDDVKDTADLREWNEDDVRLAIGRVLIDKLGIDC